MGDRNSRDQSTNDTDAYVAKLNLNGSNLVYATLAATTLLILEQLS